MSDPVSTFFAAWELDDADTRLAQINSSVSDQVQYHDPRTPETINGIAALADYVGMFNTNAPGWSAKVIRSDTVGGMTRATIAFGGMGPDGNEMVQHGQYFIEMDGAKISRMVGFVGTGT